MINIVSKTLVENRLVSIIMPCYNAEKHISEAIESVLNQTYKNFELIITDDCSTDTSASIINNYLIKDDRIKYYRNTSNLGVSATRNTSIANSNGYFIAFLDSDDIWLPEKLEKQLIVLNNGWDVVCSNYFTFKDKDSLSLKKRVSPEIISYSKLLKSNFIGNLTGIYNCNVLGKIAQKNSGHEDYIMWLEILKKSGTAYCIQEPLAKYRISDNSLSGNKFKAILWQWSIYRKSLQLPILKSLYYFSHYIINAFKKRR